MLKIIKYLKKLPIDFNQYEMRKKTKGKLIAYDLARGGNGEALDLGCRDDYWSRQLEKIGYEVIAVDIKPSYPKSQFVDANKALPFEDGRFDLIWASEVIEHLDNPEFSVSEMKRVLKSGGQIILTTPNSNVWLFRLFKFFGVPIQELQQDGHKQFFSINNIKNFFPEAEIFGFFPYFILKLKISSPSFIDWLSPAFTIYWKKTK